MMFANVIGKGLGLGDHRRVKWKRGVREKEKEKEREMEEDIVGVGVGVGCNCLLPISYVPLYLPCSSILVFSVRLGPRLVPPMNPTLSLVAVAVAVPPPPLTFFTIIMILLLTAARSPFASLVPLNKTTTE